MSFYDMIGSNLRQTKKLNLRATGTIWGGYLLVVYKISLKVRKNREKSGFGP
jgi:hypothetical protein